jgi:hypothetical protein
LGVAVLYLALVILTLVGCGLLRDIPRDY